MKKWIHESNPVEMLERIQDDLRSEYASEEDYLASVWEEIRSKQVYDFDGFLTDYTLWYNNETGEWCTVFGDKDIYHPWDADHDMNFDSEDEAQDWFDDYDADIDED